MSFPSTGSFHALGSIQKTVTLNAGNNKTLKFYNPNRQLPARPRDLCHIGNRRTNFGISRHGLSADRVYSTARRSPGAEAGVNSWLSLVRWRISEVIPERNSDDLSKKVLTQFRVSRQKGYSSDGVHPYRDVKKQINPSFNAHLLWSALILLSPVAICAIRRP